MKVTVRRLARRTVALTALPMENRLELWSIMDFSTRACFNPPERSQFLLRDPDRVARAHRTGRTAARTTRPTSCAGSRPTR